MKKIFCIALVISIIFLGSCKKTDSLSKPKKEIESTGLYGVTASGDTVLIRTSH